MTLINQNYVFVDEPLTSKEEALKFLSEKAHELGISSAVEPVYSSFLLRETEGTTGMMDGFSIPHAKNSEIKEASILIVKTTASVEWDSLDGKPINVIIALLIPDSETGTTHLKLLSTIARQLMKAEFKEKLQTLTSADEITNYINRILENE
ncbi:MAG: fructose PTS transporter subunit IIA [Lactobacillales bacterium]|jgi:PTS system fructose-specific IIA component|nr:fructose PTS transporter subunit IIA [Lactobacillales bacterium]